MICHTVIPRLIILRKYQYRESQDILTNTTILHIPIYM